MATNSYIQIIDANKLFADNHFVIKNFGNGELWQLTDHDQTQPYDYPLMYMEDAAHNTGTKEYVYGFRVWFLTRVETPSDKTGQLLYREFATAKSAMIKCAQDYISYWVQDTNYPALAVERNVNIEPVTDQEPDRLTGCYVDFKFHAAFDYNSCTLPMDGITPPSQDVTITVNGVPFYTLSPGVTANIPVKDQDGNLTGSKIGNEWIVQTGGGSQIYDVVVDGINIGSLTMDGTNHDIAW